MRMLYADPGPLPLYLNLPTDRDDFARLYPDEDHCIAHIMRMRWPDGFRCPRCSSGAYSILARPVLVCRLCRQKTWLLAGTIFEKTKLPLLKWFKAAFLMRLPYFTATYLSREMGVTYKTAWLLAHKLRASLAAVVPLDGSPAAARGEPHVPSSPPAQPPRGPSPERVPRSRAVHLRGSRPGEHPRGHRCGRLDRADLAERNDPSRPWARWIRERGPRPWESLYAEEARIQLAAQYQHALGERYLEAYLDEFAFRFNRRWHGLWSVFEALAARLPFAPAAPRRRLGAPPPPRGPRRWLALRLRPQSLSSLVSNASGRTSSPRT